MCCTEKYRCQCCFFFQVEAVPTVIAMKNGKIQEKFVGLKDDAQLESFINKLTGE